MRHPNTIMNDNDLKIILIVKFCNQMHLCLSTALSVWVKREPNCVDSHSRCFKHPLLFLDLVGSTHAVAILVFSICEYRLLYSHRYIIWKPLPTAYTVNMCTSDLVLCFIMMPDNLILIQPVLLWSVSDPKLLEIKMSKLIIDWLHLSVQATTCTVCLPFS